MDRTENSQNRGTEEFDFDAWAALYRADPDAFDARRRAVLALEMAKAGPAAQSAREALKRLDAQLEGKSDGERIQTSMAWMVASMRQLGDKMEQLQRAMSAAAPK